MYRPVGELEITGSGSCISDKMMRNMGIGDHHDDGCLGDNQCDSVWHEQFNIRVDMKRKLWGSQCYIVQLIGCSKWCVFMLASSKA
uniref:Uncharacterized protein n=1 Tax=Romanomermis culicivorax TaxID=13658 RepID=A0A915L2B9_ROMCU